MGAAAIEALLAEGDGLARPIEPAGAGAADAAGAQEAAPRLRVVGGD